MNCYNKIKTKFVLDLRLIFQNLINDAFDANK